MSLKGTKVSLFFSSVALAIILPFICAFPARLNAEALPALPEHETLVHFPPTRPPETSILTGRLLGQPISVTTIVGGQHGKLIPSGEQTLLDLSPIFPMSGDNQPEPSGLELFKTRKGALSASKTTQISSNEEMEQLLEKTRRLDAVFDAQGGHKTVQVGRKYLAVDLSDGVNAENKLLRVQREGKSFYVRGQNGKMWFFDTDDGRTFSVTDRIRPQEEAVIDGILRKKGVERLPPSSSAAIANESPPPGMTKTNEAPPRRYEAESEGADASLYEFTQTSATKRDHLRADKVAWWRKFSQGAKAWLSRHGDLTREVHGF